MATVKKQNKNKKQVFLFIVIIIFFKEGQRSYSAIGARTSYFREPGPGPKLRRMKTYGKDLQTTLMQIPQRSNRSLWQILQGLQYNVPGMKTYGKDLQTTLKVILQGLQYNVPGMKTYGTDLQTTLKQILQGLQYNITT